ncbi:MAG: hypothetical protein RL563_830, partial [Pseudomonadota bacterium]
MKNLEKNYMVWPPIGADTPSEFICRVISMLCWFAGPTAKRLRIPLSSQKKSIAHAMLEYASVTIFSDFHKIEFLDVTRAHDLLNHEEHILLLFSRDVV